MTEILAGHARRSLPMVAAFCCLALATATVGAPRATATPTRPTVLSVDDIRAITGIHEFHVPDVPGHGDLVAPVPIPDTPALCRAVYDQPVVFGTDWSQFRSVTYSADIPHPLLPGIASLVQSIAIYPDAGAARGAFERIVAAAPACSDMNADYYHRTPQHPDPNTLILNGDMVTDGYRVADTALIGVSTLVPSELAPIDALNLVDRLQDAQP
ncbi:sensor domain-containing protein [Mycobacterium aquaticum]|uniref:sensor domain-containing protein n=1 Tax=Mycobacterium aquaticum TaxID=1927124 RepID=UPI0009F5CCB1